MSQRLADPPPLNVSDLTADPLVQFERWLQDAHQTGAPVDTPMTLATIGGGGLPSARIVLYKGLYQGGLTFYTNYESRKGAELERNPRAALVFWLEALARQIRVEGNVEKLPPAVSQRYFSSRPRNSQLSAYISRQSRVVDTRAELQARMEEATERFTGKPVPCPADWGGYRVVPAMFEFWQGRPGRLHDRLVYRRKADAWTIERLEP